MNSEFAASKDSTHVTVRKVKAVSWLRIWIATVSTEPNQETMPKLMKRRKFTITMVI